jgi:hypothetical protein
MLLRSLLLKRRADLAIFYVVVPTGKRQPPLLLLLLLVLLLLLLLLRRRMSPWLFFSRPSYSQSPGWARPGFIPAPIGPQSQELGKEGRDHTQ